MDLKKYYDDIRRTEASLSDPTVVASCATADGGRAGVLVEAPRSVAARMIVEGRAVRATDEQAAAFRSKLVEAAREAEQLAMANRLQVQVVPATPTSPAKVRVKD